MDRRTRDVLRSLGITPELRAQALRDSLVQCGTDLARLNMLLGDVRTRRTIAKLEEMDPDLWRAVTDEIDEALRSAKRPSDPADEWPGPRSRGWR